MRIRFDRGTLLIDVPPGPDPVTPLPGVQWDPRTRTHRAPAWRYPEIVRELRARRAWFTDPIPARRPIDARFVPLDLRPYQLAAVEAWEAADNRGVIVLPTGSGKTRVALAALARLRMPTLCLAPTRVLLDQWCTELARVHAGPIGRLGDGDRRVEPITAATFESAYRRMPEIGDRFGLLVVDEAHHFGNGVRDEALEMSVAPYRLGLTATPPTAREPAVRLATLIGPTAYERVIPDLAGQYLADFELITIGVDLLPDELRRYRDLQSLYKPLFREFWNLQPEAGWPDFVRAASKTDDGRRALDSWRRAKALTAFSRGKDRALAELLARHRDNRVLVFTADNATAYRVAREHLVMPITCDIGRKEREVALQRFRDGELRALVSARVLNEGVDVPAADVAIVVGGTQGQREHTQRVGRVLRPAEGKKALVYELVVRRTAEVTQWIKRRDGLVSRKATPVYL